MFPKSVLQNYTPPPYTESGLVEVSPNPAIIPTTILQSGTSQIVMRKFQTISEVSYLETTTKYRGDNYFYQEPEEITTKSEEELVATRTPSPFMKAMYDNHIGCVSLYFLLFYIIYIKMNMGNWYI